MPEFSRRTGEVVLCGSYLKKLKNKALSKERGARMLAWRDGGFSAHNAVSVAGEDAKGVLLWE